jgi:hypothetical protein
MELQFEDNEYYLVDENNDTIATTDSVMLKACEYVKKLSLKNCEAIERGYDLDELASERLSTRFDENSGYHKFVFVEAYKEGFQKALEILGDKKFSEEDVLKELNKLNTMPNSTLDTFTDDGEMVTMKWFEQSLQQTEWDVSVEIEQLATFTSMPKEGEKRLSEKPKLDSNGCLILKRL